MKKIIELTIPIVVGLTWGALVISSMVEVKEMAAVLMRPSFEESIEVRPAVKPASLLLKQGKTRLAGAPLIAPETVG